MATTWGVYVLVYDTMCNIGVGAWSSIRYPNSISYPSNIRLEFPIFCGTYCEVRHRIVSVTNGSLVGLFHLLSRFPSFKAFTL